MTSKVSAPNQRKPRASHDLKVSAPNQRKPRASHDLQGNKYNRTYRTCSHCMDLHSDSDLDPDPQSLL